MADLQVCLLGIDHWSTCMTRAEWSGWVQAVGSVGALLGIWYTVRKQRDLAIDAEGRLQRAATATALSRSRTAIASISAVASQLYDSISNLDPAVLRLHRSRLVEGLMLAQEVALETLPLKHQGAVLAVRHMAVMIRDCIDLILEAATDRARTGAVITFTHVMNDQLKKVADHERTIAMPA